MSKRTRWILAFAAAGVFFALAALAAGLFFARRLGPILREQTIAFLEERFQATVEVDSLRITSHAISPWKAIVSRGRGAFLEVTADGIRVRQQSQSEIPPLLTMRRLRFDFELASVGDPPIRVRHVLVEGLDFVLPPKGERPQIFVPESKSENRPGAERRKGPVFADAITADGMRLVILPARKDRLPLQFEMRRLRLHSAGTGRPVSYDAVLTNPKPPGMIESRGTFGPFDAKNPAESPVEGSYVFRHADLGVFRSISGTLESTGRFAGRLNQTIVDGEANVPDFRLSAVGNTVPLHTRFHAIVDGTNGDTILQPVNARLGNSAIWVQGAVERRPGENGKTVSLTAISKAGVLEDFLRLAVRGDAPPMKGGIALTVKLIVPPGREEYAKRLIVNGTFELTEANFTNPEVQSKLDDLSRRAQGKPNQEDLAQIPSDFVGAFDLRRSLLKVSRLMFHIPGAELELAGSFDLVNEAIDISGPVRTQARVSQMVKSRWKRILLKPVDPFFARDGAGTAFYLQVKGTRGKPDFKVSRKPPTQ